MKHLATIQKEFLKTARNWDDLSVNEQKNYLKKHPKSKRRITARPGNNKSTTLEPLDQKVKNKISLHLKKHKNNYNPGKLPIYKSTAGWHIGSPDFYYAVRMGEAFSIFSSKGDFIENAPTSFVNTINKVDEYDPKQLSNEDKLFSKSAPARVRDALYDKADAMVKKMNLKSDDDFDKVQNWLMQEGEKSEDVFDTDVSDLVNRYKNEAKI